MVFDIAHNKDGRWCAADEGIGAKSLRDVPYVEMIEYQQECNAIQRALNYWNDFESKKNKRENPYEGLYIAEPTNNSYILPYLSDYHHNITQKWMAGQGPSEDNDNRIKWMLQKAGEKTGWAGVEQPESWSGQDLAEWSFSFYLINTFDPDKDILNHLKFLGTIMSQNMLGRPDAITYVPPCIYKIHIPGIRFAPVATVSKLTVQNIGAVHAHTVPGINTSPVLVPDAWKVDIHIHEHILESRRILETVFSGEVSKVEAISV